MNDKLTKQLQELLKMKDDLVDNLNAKGLVASKDETLETLVPKVLAILQVQGDLTLGTKKITQDGDYFPSNDGVDAYSSVSVSIMKDNDALIKFLEILGRNRMKRIEAKGNIPSFAFNNSSDLQEINLDGCEEIGQYAFASCNNLSTFTNNKIIKSIDQYAFNSCSVLDTELVLDDSITTIPPYTFQNCFKLKVNIPKSAKIIKQSAYRGCTNMILDALPEGLESVETYGFYNTTNLTAKVLPPISMGTYAFAYSGVQFKEVPLGCTFSNYAFDHCSGLTSLKFNNEGVIPNWCFQNCVNLEEIELGTGITTINTNSFRNCSKLKTITCHRTTPPTLVYNAINSCPIEEIYVPVSALEEYKSATNWSTYADKMIPIEGE